MSKYLSSEKQYFSNYKLAAIILVSAVFTAVLIACNEEPPVASEPNIEENYLQPDEVLAELDKVNQKINSSISKTSGHHKYVELPAGSVDGLADAIDQAGKNGTVLVKSGLHQESGTVTVTERVKIIGEPGAVLEVDTKPEPVAGKLDPAIHIKNTKHVIIWGLEINPVESVGGTAILIENAPGCVIAKNTFYQHQFGVMMENGEHSIVWKNHIVTSNAWQTGAVPQTIGVVNINGRHAAIVDNELSGGFLGAFTCDRGGLFYQNHMYDNFIGLLVCRVPENRFTLPDEQKTGAMASGNHWLIKGNAATNNLNIGYLVIDGANNNLLLKNHAANNGLYDIELAGESLRFGFYTPTSFENKVIIKNPNLIVKDCGVDNKVKGGSLVDNLSDPCF